MLQEIASSVPAALRPYRNDLIKEKAALPGIAFRSVIARELTDPVWLQPRQSLNSDLLQTSGCFKEIASSVPAVLRPYRNDLIKEKAALFGIAFRSVIARELTYASLAATAAISE